MVMTMLVEVDDDWTSTVTSTPIMSPATGLLSTSLLANTLPAAFPEHKETVVLGKLLLCQELRGGSGFLRR